MANIRLFDGTKSPDLGVFVEYALKELGKVVPVSVSPMPGSYDLASFNLVQEGVRNSFNAIRNQVHLHQLLEWMYAQSEFQTRGSQRIILTEPDLYAGRLNWCFGGFVPFELGDVLMPTIVISSHRVKDDPIHAIHLIAHEIGHMYGAAPGGRSNTVENLGSHCTNDGCVMLQQVTMAESKRYAHLRNSSNKEVYCAQCSKDIDTYHQKMF